MTEEGIAPNEELTCEGIVRSVGNAINVALSDTDISVMHPIPSFNTTAPPRLIVKFTTREVRDRFYSNHKNLVKKHVKDIPGLGSDGYDSVYISESLMPSRKKLFGEIKIKKSRKWKFIWTYNGQFSFVKLNIPGSMASIQRRISLNSVDIDASITCQHSE